MAEGVPRVRFFRADLRLRDGIFQQFHNQKKVVVNWIVADKDDDILIECGEDYKEDMENLRFNIKIKQ
jgi:hypothetical protein